MENQTEIRENDTVAHVDEKPLIDAALRDAGPLESNRQCSETRALTDQKSLPPSAEAMKDFIPGYEILKELQRGGQGAVYQATQKSTGKTVAVKVIHRGPLADSGNRARLERGVHILSQLNYPNIVRIIDSGCADGTMYYVMDFIEGQSLDQWLAEKRISSLEAVGQPQGTGLFSSRRRASESSRRQRIEISEIIGLFVKICDAVAAAHVRGVIHRDLKPGNIRVDPRGEPHILDFDLAKIIPGDLDPEGRWMDMTETGEFLGSLRWSSPEQVERIPGKIDLRTDVYSLGVILYELLTGQPPYPALGSRRELEEHILTTEPIRPSKLRRRIADDLDTILLKCLSKEPARRYPLAAALAEDLRCYQSGFPISARRDSTLYVLRKLARRHAAATVAIIALIVTLASTSAISMHFYGRERDAAREKSVLAQASVEQAKASELRAHAAEAQVYRLMLGWFLLEWHADRLQASKEIRDKTPRIIPEYKAMQFLLDASYPEERFLAELPADESGMGLFVVGERNRKAGRNEEAAQAYEACAALRRANWYRDAAIARLDLLRKPHESARSKDTKME